MLTNLTRATVVQLLQSLSVDSVRLLFLKHLDTDLGRVSPSDLLEILKVASPDAVAGLLVELIGGQTSIRSDAPTKYVFDGRLEELRRRLRADGYEVVEEALTRLLPTAEPVNRIADELEQILVHSTIDSDGEIRRLLRESHSGLSGSPPDYNGSTAKARIALETVARRAAWLVADHRRMEQPAEQWGAALSFLRTADVITKAEEEAVAKVYTLISPGAHVPKGLNDEQWALLARSFTVAAAYFLIRQHAAA